MSSINSTVNVAVLDDYQNVALKMADWSPLDGRAIVTVFNDHVVDADRLVERLLPFDVVCVMRERTPLTRVIIEGLPRLKLIASTAFRNASIDVAAAAERGVVVTHTGYDSSATVELTWALILGSTRHLAAESTALRSGGWQHTIGDGLQGKRLGVLGLGNIGSEVARLGLAFGMKVIAWSQNLTAEKAETQGARLVSKEELFQQADIVTIHLVLSDRTRGLVGAPELAAMKPSARLVNTSRGPLVKEAALIDALREGRIAGAALDVFDIEPLPSVTRIGHWRMFLRRRILDTYRASYMPLSIAIPFKTLVAGWISRSATARLRDDKHRRSRAAFIVTALGLSFRGRQLSCREHAANTAGYSCRVVKIPRVKGEPFLVDDGPQIVIDPAPGNLEPASLVHAGRLAAHERHDGTRTWNRFGDHRSEAGLG